MRYGLGSRDSHDPRRRNYEVPPVKKLLVALAELDRGPHNDKGSNARSTLVRFLYERFQHESRKTAIEIKPELRVQNEDEW